MEEGERFPKFKLMDQDGNEFDSESLAGKAYVVYFYPRDNTPGCTAEALGFNAALDEFDAMGIKIIGANADSVASHSKFVEKHGLRFTLLSDPDKALLGAAGVWGTKKMYGREYEGVFRSTFLVGPDGLVAKVWKKVKVKGHVEEVLAAASAMA